MACSVLSLNPENRKEQVKYPRTRILPGHSPSVAGSRWRGNRSGARALLCAARARPKPEPVPESSKHPTTRRPGYACRDSAEHTGCLSFSEFPTEHSRPSPCKTHLFLETFLHRHRSPKMNSIHLLQ